MPDLLETDIFFRFDLFSRAFDLITTGFIGQIVELCNLYIIFLSSTSCGSIKSLKPCVRAQAVTNEIQICQSC